VSQGGHPNEVKHEGKSGLKSESRNEGVQAPLPKGVEKRKKGRAGRIHAADGIPPKARSPVAGRKAGKTGNALRRRRGGEAQAAEKTPAEQEGQAGIDRGRHHAPAPRLELFLVQMRQDTRAAHAPADGQHRNVAGLRHHGGNRGKAQKDKPGDHRQAAARGQADHEAQGEKPHQAASLFEKPHTGARFLQPRREADTGLLADGHRPPPRQATCGQYLLSLAATDVFSGWLELRPMLNNARKWAYEALIDIKASTPMPVLEFHRL